MEIIRGLATSDETTQRVMAWSKAVGKTPVEVDDFPGFVANRLGVYGMVLVIRQTEKHDLTLDEVDVLTGVLTGRSKSAT